MSLPEELVEVWPGTGKAGKTGYAQLKLEAMLGLSEGRLSGLSVMSGWAVQEFMLQHDSRKI